jgi:hypothetical protein
VPTPASTSVSCDFLHNPRRGDADFLDLITDLRRIDDAPRTRPKWLESLDITTDVLD